MTEPVTGRKPHTYAGVNPPPLTHVSQWLTLAVGVAYLGAGLAGWAVTDGVGFASDEGGSLLGFEVNPLHNLVHLAIGLTGVLLWRTVTTAKLFGLALLAGYGLTTVYGLIALGAEWDVLAINGADNALHLGSALVGAGIMASAKQALDSGGPYQ